MSTRKMSNSKRQDRRRLTTFKLKNNLIIRRDPTASEVLAFVHDIEKNDVSKFGIVKLSRLELDNLYKHPYRDEHSTIIRYAANMTREPIVSSLLIAGADPTVFSCICPPCIGADDGDDRQLAANGANPYVAKIVMEKLTRLSKPLAVWFIRRLSDTKRSFAKMMQSSVQSLTAFACQSCSSRNEDDVEEWMAHERCNGRCSLLHFEHCHHVLCESCFWMCSVVWEDKNDCSAEDIHCPVCSKSGNNNCSGNSDHSTSSKGDEGNRNISSYTSNCAELTSAITNADERTKKIQSSVQLSSPSSASSPSAPQVAIESKARYLLLPEVFDGSQRNKKEQFRAMKRQEVACIQLGSKRSKRDDELWKAALAGNCKRLKALIEAGVDLEAANEYGQTAICFTAWLGHRVATSLLVHCGANVHRCDNAGVSVLQAAVASGCDAVIEIVQRAATEGAPLEICSSLHCLRLLEKCPESTVEDMQVTWLISRYEFHQGAGSLYIDGAFSDEFLDELRALFVRLPVAPTDRGALESATRSYYCDAQGRVTKTMARVLSQLQSLISESDNGPDQDQNQHHDSDRIYDSDQDQDCYQDQDRGVLTVRTQQLRKKIVAEALPHMRFLYYDQEGGCSPPHTDLCRNTLDGRSSTHTFILYLSDCTLGGATNLLRCVCPKRNTSPDDNIMARVEPKNGRLLIFPHVCPHEGEKVVELPKLLLRGEMT